MEMNEIKTIFETFNGITMSMMCFRWRGLFIITFHCEEERYHWYYIREIKLIDWMRKKYFSLNQMKRDTMIIRDVCSTLLIVYRWKLSDLKIKLFMIRLWMTKKVDLTWYVPNFAILIYISLSIIQHLVY